MQSSDVTHSSDSFNVVSFFLGVVMHLIKWRQRRELHGRRFWRAHLGEFGQPNFVLFRLTQPL